eukprot:1372825-Pleurochrysis_carterae.AAC.1
MFALQPTARTEALELRGLLGELLRQGTQPKKSKTLSPAFQSQSESQRAQNAADAAHANPPQVPTADSARPTRHAMGAGRRRSHARLHA